MKNTWNTVKIYFQELTEVITIILMIIVGFCINDHSNDEETGNYTRVVDSCQTNCTFAVENEMQLVPTNSTVLKKTPTIEKLNNISEYIRRCRDEIKKCEDEDIVRLIHLRQKLKSLTKCIKEIKSSNLKVKELQSYNIDQIRITLKKIDNKLKNHNPTQTKLTGVTRISPESTELNQVKSSNSQLDNTESHPSINYFNDASKDIYREDETVIQILKMINQFRESVENFEGRKTNKQFLQLENDINELQSQINDLNSLNNLNQESYFTEQLNLLLEKLHRRARNCPEGITCDDDEPNQINNRELELKKHNEVLLKLKEMPVKISKYKQEIEVFKGGKDDLQFFNIDKLLRHTLLEIRNITSVDTNITKQKSYYIVQLRILINELIKKVEQNEKEESFSRLTGKSSGTSNIQGDMCTSITSGKQFVNECKNEFQTLDFDNLKSPSGLITLVDTDTEDAYHSKKLDRQMCVLSSTECDKSLKNQLITHTSDSNLFDDKSSELISINKNYINESTKNKLGEGDLIEENISKETKPNKISSFIPDHTLINNYHMEIINKEDCYDLIEYRKIINRTEPNYFTNEEVIETSFQHNSELKNKYDEPEAKQLSPFYNDSSLTLDSKQVLNNNNNNNKESHSSWLENNCLVNVVTSNTHQNDEEAIRKFHYVTSNFSEDNLKVEPLIENVCNFADQAYSENNNGLENKGSNLNENECDNFPESLPNVEDTYTAKEEIDEDSFNYFKSIYNINNEEEVKNEEGAVCNYNSQSKIEHMSPFNDETYLFNSNNNECEYKLSEYENKETSTTLKNFEDSDHLNTDILNHEISTNEGGTSLNERKHIDILENNEYIPSVIPNIEITSLFSQSTPLNYIKPFSVADRITQIKLDVEKLGQKISDFEGESEIEYYILDICLMDNLKRINSVDTNNSHELSEVKRKILLRIKKLDKILQFKYTFLRQF